jgi:hypothetical protein
VRGPVGGEFLRVDVKMGSRHCRSEGVSFVDRRDPRDAPGAVGSHRPVLRAGVGGEIRLDAVDGDTELDDEGQFGQARSPAARTAGGESRCTLCPPQLPLDMQAPEGQQRQQEAAVDDDRDEDRGESWPQSLVPAWLT